MFAVILAIMTAILLVVMLYNTYKKLQVDIQAKGKKKYEQLCPDYWELVRREKDDKGREYSVCKNTHKLGLCALDPERNTFSFDDELFVNPNSGDLSKCKWAKQCGVSWTGYDNKCS